MLAQQARILRRFFSQYFFRFCLTIIVKKDFSCYIQVHFCGSKRSSLAIQPFCHSHTLFAHVSENGTCYCYCFDALQVNEPTKVSNCKPISQIFGTQLPHSFKWCVCQALRAYCANRAFNRIERNQRPSVLSSSSSSAVNAIASCIQWTFYSPQIVLCDVVEICIRWHTCQPSATQSHLVFRYDNYSNGVFSCLCCVQFLWISRLCSI